MALTQAAYYRWVIHKCSRQLLPSLPPFTSALYPVWHHKCSTNDVDRIFSYSDIWWLIWGVFLIAIIERHNLLDDDLKWFDLFRILFELVSAFGGIGLSLGIPTVSPDVSSETYGSCTSNDDPRARRKTIHLSVR